MKKLSAIVLALCLSATLALPAFAEDTVLPPDDPQETGTEQPAQTPPAVVHSAVLSTKSGGQATGVNSTSIEKGKQLTVTFSKENFNWSQGTSGQYAIGSFLSTWVNVSDSSFTYAGAWIDAATGSVTVAFTANQAYPQGTTLTVSLDSSLVGAANNTTAAYTGTITVTDPAAQQPQSQQQPTSSSSQTPESSTSSSSQTPESSTSSSSQTPESSTSSSSQTPESSTSSSSQTSESSTSSSSQTPESSTSSSSQTPESSTSSSSQTPESSTSSSSQTPESSTSSSSTPESSIAPETVTPQQPAAAPSPGTVTGATAGTAPTTNSSYSLTTDLSGTKMFTIVFPSDNFTTDGLGGFVLGGLANNTSAVTFTPADAPFQGMATSIDPATGDVTVTISANGAYDGPLGVQLNYGGGASSTANISSVVVVDPTTTSTITKTKAGAPPTVSVNGVAQTGEMSLTTGDKIVFTFPADNFEWSSTTGKKDARSLADAGWIKLSSGITAGSDFSVAYTTPAGSEDVQVTLTALRAKNYSGLQVWLQDNVNGGKVATTKSTAQKVTVTSTNAGKIDGISSDAQLGGKHSGATLNGKAIYDLEGLEVKYDDEILIPLYAGFFTWTGDAPYEGTPVTTSQLSSGKIKVGSSNKKGSSVFEKPEIVSKNGQAYVKVKFVESGATVKDIDFEMTVYLSVGSKRNTDSQAYINGTLTHEYIEIDDDEDYIDISDGSVVEPSSYVRNVELYLGNGVSIYSNLYANKKYSGTAKIDMSSADEKLLEKYPTIDLIISVRTTNLSGNGSKVVLDYDNYYVYDQDGKYIGTTKDKLPYASKYYLSTTKIDLEGEKTPPDNNKPPVWAEEVPPEDKPIVNNVPPNINDVPGTGC